MQNYPLRCWILLLALASVCATCRPRIDTAQKVHYIPNSWWKSQDTLHFAFRLSDTSHHYKIYFIFQHLHTYHYRNIWLKATLYRAKTDPSSADNFRFSLNLADDEKGWLGSGMDNAYESRVFWKTIKPKVAGVYCFDVHHVMEEDPLWAVQGVGMRLER